MAEKAIQTNNGSLITAGGDHRVGIKPICKIMRWRTIEPYQFREDPQKMSKIRRYIELEDNKTKYFRICGN